MPEETPQAIQWALQQTVHMPFGSYEVTLDTPHALVDMVRVYFNENNIGYSTYSYDDLKLYLN